MTAPCYGHAALLAAQCADDPTCSRVAVVRDDDQPEVQRCGEHAVARLVDPISGTLLVHDSDDSPCDRGLAPYETSVCGHGRRVVEQWAADVRAEKREQRRQEWDA